MTEITIAKPYDMHVHLREGAVLRTVAKYTAEDFYRALVMPNLTRPIRTAEDVVRYKQEIMAAVGPERNFEPLMTFKIFPDTDPHTIKALAGCATAGKIYPKGLTHNAHDGVDDFFALRKVYHAMEEHDLVLCLHGEMPGKNIKGRQREQKFLPILEFLVSTYPNLRIVLEHITTKAAVETVVRLPPTVAATITVHHLLLTADDVGGDRLCPNNFCKPIAKDPQDRAMLIQAAISGCPKFFFGSDSAPHLQEGKQRLYDCCAGIFTAPVALPLLAEIFERENALDRLELFVREFGRRFYRVAEPVANPPAKLRLTKETWTVPSDIGGVVPFWIGTPITWKVTQEIR